MSLHVDLLATVPGVGDVAISGRITEETEGPDPLGALQDWLARIDPDELERVALEHMSLDGASPGHAILGTLRRWAGGDT